MSTNLDPFIESLVLKIKTRKEVAAEYGTTARTLVKKLNRKGIIIPPGDIFPSTLKIIYYTLGIPAALKINNYHRGNN